MRGSKEPGGRPEHAGEPARIDRSAVESLATELGGLNEDLSSVAAALAKTSRKFARERKAIAVGLDDPEASLGALSALRHYMTAEIDTSRHELARIAARLRP